MAAILRGSWNWLKMAWDRQPVLVVAVGMSLLGEQVKMLFLGSFNFSGIV